MPTSLVVAPEVKIDGAALKTELRQSLVDLRVVHGLGVPAYARLSFQVGDSEADIDSISTKLGDQITIGCTGPVGETQGIQSWQIFDGLVASLGVEFDAGMGAVVVIEAYDKLYKLGRTSVAKNFKNIKASDIISTLAGKAGLSAQVDATAVVWDSRYQYGTDYAYLDGLVREIGYEWFVDDGTLYARKRSGSATVTLEYGENLRSFKARFSAMEHADKVQVRGWDVETKEQILGEATHDGSKAQSAIGVSQKNKLTKATGGDTVMSIPRAVRTQEHAKQLAASIFERRAAEALRARGEIDPTPDVKPGTLLKLEGLGTNFSGDYYCTQVEYVFGGHDGSMRTLFEVGPSDPESLVDIFGGGATPTLDKMLGSLTVGIVTNNNDEDGGLQRVKVKLPYLSDELETGWARVLQPGAGADRGWTVIPEIDDEVLVGFEHGDIDHPYVLGGLINNKDKQKYETTDLVEDGKVVARVFNSRLGHEIRLSDGKNPPEQFVRVNTPGEPGKCAASLFLGEEKIELEGKQGLPIKVFAGKSSIEITKDGDIALETMGNITLKATKDVTIEGQNVNVKSKLNTKVEAGTNLDLKGLNTALEAQVSTTVKGPASVKIN